MINWNEYDEQTEQHIKKLKDTLDWSTTKCASDSAAIVGAYTIQRDIDKVVLKEVIEVAKRQAGDI